MFLLSLVFISPLAKGQTGEENRNLVFDTIDLKIIQRAESILSDTSKWNKHDDRKCDDDFVMEVIVCFAPFIKHHLTFQGNTFIEDQQCKL